VRPLRRALLLKAESGLKYDKINPFNSVNIRLVRHVAAHPGKLRCVWRVWGGARRCAKESFDKRSVVAAAPTTVILRLTHRCNQRCVQCGLWGENGALKDMGPNSLNNELSTRQFVSVIERIAPARPFISFFGGEPTLRGDLGQLVAAASSHGMLTTMNTNGLLLSEHAAEIVRAGLGFCKVSLDGPKDVNDRIRRGSDSYEKTVAGVRELLRERERQKSPTPIVQICSTVTNENQYDLIEIAQIADRLGVDLFALLFGIFTTEELVHRTNVRMKELLGVESTYWPGFVMDRSAMDIDAIRTQVEAIKRRNWRFKYKQYPDDTRVFDIDTHYNRPNEVHGRGLCIVPWFRMQVMPNGDVALCEDTPDYIAGNILEQDPLDIWNGERYQTFRQTILDEGIFPVCARCSALYEIPHYKNDSLPRLVL